MDGAAPIGGPLLLDTTVYIDVLHGRTPEAVDMLLRLRVCQHSAVCLAELAHAFGRLDPRHAGTKGALHEIAGVIRDIPAHRLHAPDRGLWGSAGMLAGLVFRLSGRPSGRGHERKLLNDALLHLQGRSLGCTVLTRNVRDFDRLNQLVPEGRILLYRPGAAGAA